MKLPTLAAIFDRWIPVGDEAPRGSRWFRRHGQKPEPDTARKTAPKGGARRRRFLESRARTLRREARAKRAANVV